MAVNEETSREYRTIGVLAKGGMGQVELAVRVRANFQRLYAVKRLRPEYRQNDEFRLMFLDEGRIAGLLRHPNIVSVLDVGEDDAGPYLVMELVEGLNGSAFIAAHRSRNAMIPEQIVLRIVRDVALGLAAAHDQVGLEGEPLGLVHRDVSPQNILVDFDGTVKVTDFGIAKAFGRLAETSTGLLKGKAGYMSPEQLRFEDLDRRSDLFSLGVVFYELLAGQRLYRRETATEIARAILGEAPPDIMSTRPSTHHLVCELLFELLAKKPQYRPADAGEVAERVGALLEELVTDEGEMTLREYMLSTFGNERTAITERQNTLLLESGQGSAPIPAAVQVSASPERRRSLRRIMLAATLLIATVFTAVALVAMLRGGDGTSTDGGFEESAAEATDSEASHASVQSPIPAPVVIPAVTELPETSTSSEMTDHELQDRGHRRRRRGRRQNMNARRLAASMDGDARQAAVSMAEAPGALNATNAMNAMTSTTMTTEAGTRARSHAVAF